MKKTSNLFHVWLEKVLNPHWKVFPPHPLPVPPRAPRFPALSFVHYLIRSGAHAVLAGELVHIEVHDAPNKLLWPMP